MKVDETHNFYENFKLFIVFLNFVPILASNVLNPIPSNVSRSQRPRSFWLTLANRIAGHRNNIKSRWKITRA